MLFVCVLFILSRNTEPRTGLIYCGQGAGEQHMAHWGTGELWGTHWNCSTEAELNDREAAAASFALQLVCFGISPWRWNPPCALSMVLTKHWRLSSTAAAPPSLTFCTGLSRTQRTNQHIRSTSHVLNLRRPTLSDCADWCLKESHLPSDFVEPVLLQFIF
jgi:hypothetical protein